MEAWYIVCSSDTLDIFEGSWSGFLKTYGIVADYFRRQWYPKREKFVKCFIKYVEHFNHFTNNMCEGMHSALKKDLASRPTLLTAYREVKILASSQSIAIDNAISREKRSFPTTVTNEASRHLYIHLRGKVSAYALQKLVEQEQLARILAPIDVCTGAFYSSMGLPCKHTIAQCLRKKEPIPLAVVNWHWRLDKRNDLYDPPAIERGRGRPRGSTNARELSHFEYIEERVEGSSSRKMPKGPKRMKNSSL